MSVVVDASVWVSAADPADPTSSTSRALLSTLAAQRVPVRLPAHAHLEVACALARRLRSAEAARKLARDLLAYPLLTVRPLDTSLLDAALQLGTESFLRSGDALYLASVEGNDDLVTWDTELVERGGGVSPADWLAARE